MAASPLSSSTTETTVPISIWACMSNSISCISASCAICQAGQFLKVPSQPGKRRMVDNGRYAPGSVKTFACPQCGGTINIRAVGISITAICQSCGSIVDVANEELSIISKVRTSAKADLRLPLGTRGHLFDADWEVIGYLERGDSGNTYFWSEYLLFNPWQGFR